METVGGTAGSNARTLLPALDQSDKLSIEQDLFKANSVYPNPARDVLQIVSNPLMPVEEFMLMDLGGNVVIKQPISAEGSLNISHLPSGVYIALIRDSSGGEQTIKIVKE